MLLIVVRLAYEGAHVFIEAYSIISPDSLSHIENKWHAEKMKHNPDCPWILVGTKTDLRNDRYLSKTKLIKNNFSKTKFIDVVQNRV